MPDAGCKFLTEGFQNVHLRGPAGRRRAYVCIFREAEGYYSRPKIGI